MTATPARTMGPARRDGTASFVIAPALASGTVPVREVSPFQSPSVYRLSYIDDVKIDLALFS